MAPVGGAGFPPNEFQQSFGDRKVDFAVGSVFGARWWTWTGDRLRGMIADWDPGVNHARCLAIRSSYAVFAHSFGSVVAAVPTVDYTEVEHDGGCPQEDCSCGFYAFWESDQAAGQAGAMSSGILGVAEGFGRNTLLGDRGFRAEQARIVAAAVVSEQRAKEYLRFFGRDRSQLEWVADEIADTYQIPVYASAEEMLGRHPLSTPPSTE